MGLDSDWDFIKFGLRFRRRPSSAAEDTWESWTWAQSDYAEFGYLVHMSMKSATRPSDGPISPNLPLNRRLKSALRYHGPQSFLESGRSQLDRRDIFVCAGPPGITAIVRPDPEGRKNKGGFCSSLTKTPNFLSRLPWELHLNNESTSSVACERLSLQEFFYYAPQTIEILATKKFIVKSRRSGISMQPLAFDQPLLVYLGPGEEDMLECMETEG
ncbi:hypothetical protein QBC40DRAFT_301722 [Triangularia verruculosa]|uniref:Uncharacterized protein n=1 Tax=Triangularia verruculosa TaxID=2587418 RepID=A0AAN6X6A2_9PEZI|nr:hypothetical protein QBC40DRAFT_301722 [Triangularia verruculosa]